MTSNPKHQNFPSQITTVETSHKQPPSCMWPQLLFGIYGFRIFPCFDSLVSNHLAHGFISMLAEYHTCLYSVLSTLPDNVGDSRFWTVSPSLQIRVWNLPDNHWSLLFLVDSTLWLWNIISHILRCLSYVMNIKRFLINPGRPLKYEQ